MTPRWWRRPGVTLSEQLEIEGFLDAAFDPLRTRTSAVSAARVRAAIRWGTVETAPPRVDGWRRLLLAGKMAETSLALGVTTLVFAGSLSFAAPDAAPDPVVDTGARPRVSRPMEDARLIRWLRLEREVPLNDMLGTEPPLDPSQAAPAAPRVATEPQTSALPQ